MQRAHVGATFGVMSNEQRVISPNNKYVTEVVWLPTYVGVVLLLVGALGVGAIEIFLGLVASRAILDLTYRIVFGERRHELRTKLIAFASQLVVWGLVWVWYAQRLTASSLN